MDQYGRVCCCVDTMMPETSLSSSQILGQSFGIVSLIRFAGNIASSGSFVEIVSQMSLIVGSFCHLGS